jgi:hypothetical protein
MSSPLIGTPEDRGQDTAMRLMIAAPLLSTMLALAAVAACNDTGAGARDRDKDMSRTPSTAGTQPTSPAGSASPGAPGSPDRLSRRVRARSG